MIVNHWPAYFRDLYGGEWPRNYVCFDLETTGYSLDRDVIVEWGHVIVEDGRPVDRLSLILDWSNHPIVPDHWLRQRLANVAAGMAARGHNASVTYERMREEGMRPERALKFVHDFIAALRKNDSLFVAHGGYAFDEKMLAANFKGFGTAPAFAFGDNDILDTEGIEKASQAVNNPRVHPRRGDTLRSYFHRVRYTRLSGVKSSLSDHCFVKYGFAERGVRRAGMHSADTDALCCHLLMEIFRDQMRDGPPPPEPEAARPAAAYPAPARPAPPRPPRGRRRGQRSN